MGQVQIGLAITKFFFQGGEIAPEGNALYHTVGS